MDKNIPLSQLIRIGSKGQKQARGMLLDLHGAFCALGAALRAKLGEIPSRNVILNKELNITVELMHDIIRWNDVEELSFEDISQRLEERGL